MDRNDGPTVFDINKPNTYGATPSARPVITGHQPTMPDPMVTVNEDTSTSGSKIKVKVGDDKLNPDELASSLFPQVKESAATASDRSPKKHAMAGEPLQSPPFKPDSDGKSAAQTATYMPVSDLTGISQSTNPPPKTVADQISDEQITTEPKPSVFGSSNNTPIDDGPPPKPKKSRARAWLWLLLLLALLGGAYAAIDKGLILDSLNLPYHIFPQDKAATTDSAPAAGSATQATIPAGFSGTKLVEAGLAFSYPTTWGAPSATTDLGFSKRSASAKPDANYAFVVNFPDNKDVQLAITSGKFLPPARATLYYDYLGWCVGTVDAKYYAGVLRFNTDADKNDTPTTVTCDQGPLNNVAKLSSDTIVQTNVKNTDGAPLGDVYSKNLKNNDYVAVRVKDATMKNGDQIKTLLGTFENTSKQ